MTPEDCFQRRERQTRCAGGCHCAPPAIHCGIQAKIVREADACSQAGELGALLRREGLYSSRLVTWRRARDRGELVSAPKRGRKPKGVDPNAKRVAEFERQNARLLAHAERAEALVELQEKSLRYWANRFRTRSRDGMVGDVGARLGIAATCSALCLPRATFHRGLLPTKARAARPSP